MSVRVGCVGTGFMAGKHLNALAGFEDVEVVAVADAVPERAREVAAAHDAQPYDDGLVMLREQDLDAVWLCVPPFAHGELERAALARNLPFFVEKPVANDLATAVAIAEEVADRGLLAAVGYHWRYLSVVEEAAALLRRTPPALVNGFWLDKTPPVAWWSRRGDSGGQVLEQTTHLFDLARHLVGEVDVVHALEVGPTDLDGGDPAAAVPLAASATLGFRSGCVGSISSARLLHARHRVALHVMGDGYVLELAERSLVDHELRISTADGERVQQTDEDPVAREDRAFLDAVLGRGDDVRAPYADAVRSHALAWAADRSAREGRALRPEVAGA